MSGVTSFDQTLLSSFESEDFEVEIGFQNEGPILCNELHFHGSPVSALDDDWSVGSPVLSITSVDPESPSLKFIDRSQIPAEVGDTEPAADLRQKTSNYLQYIDSLSQAYESRLKALCEFFRSQETTSGTTYADDPSVEIIEISKDGQRRLVAIDDADTLIDYFTENEEDSDHQYSVVSKAIFIEKLSPGILGILGAKLGVEPRFWDAHLSLTNGSTTGSGQIVRYGSEQGSRISFLSIPMLRRRPYPGRSGGQRVAGDEPNREYEGCSIHLNYGNKANDISTFLVLTDKDNENYSNSDSIGKTKSLRTNFLETLILNPREPEILSGQTSCGDVAPDLLFDLVKAIMQHLESTIVSVPQHTHAEISTFTIDIFKDEAEAMRQSIWEEHAVLTNLIQSFRVSLAAVEEIEKFRSNEINRWNASEKLQPLLRKFQDSVEEVRDWLGQIESTVIHLQEKRAARLRRVKITVPLCSLSVVLIIVVILLTNFPTKPIKVEV